MTFDNGIEYARRPSQGIVFGLDLGGLISIAVAAALVLLGMLIARGPLGIVLALPVAVPLTINGWRKRDGVSRNTHTYRRLMFKKRDRAGQTSYRRKTEPVEHGKVDLPGRRAPLDVWETDAGDMVMWNPEEGTATVFCLVATPGTGADGTSVLSEEERTALVEGWMVVCGSWTRRRQIQHVGLLERTRPGTIVREEAAFAEIDTTGLEDVAASYVEGLRQAAEDIVLQPTVLAITLSAASAVGRKMVKAQGGGKAGVMAMAQKEIKTTTESLFDAGFTRVAWWNPREWSAWGRGIVDPSTEPSIDLRIGSVHEGVAPEVAGPMAYDEYPEHVRTDSAFHRAYWVMEWPRLRTFPGFMSAVVKAKNFEDVPVRHVYCQVGVPVPIEKALAKIDDDRKNWETNSRIRAKRGDGNNRRDDADWDNLDDHEDDLISGQGELKATGYILVSGLTEAAMESACASMENAAAGAGIELFSMVHQQGAALMAIAYPGSGTV